MGKGGETIKSICAQSGAHCQVDKTAPEGAREKTIVIKVRFLVIYHACLFIDTAYIFIVSFFSVRIRFMEKRFGCPKK